MLNSITINNFKAIQSEKGLTLNNLASVNYLVGENGCGKSSVLETISIFDICRTKKSEESYTFSEDQELHTYENYKIDLLSNIVDSTTEIKLILKDNSDNFTSYNMSFLGNKTSYSPFVSDNNEDFNIFTITMEKSSLTNPVMLTNKNIVKTELNSYLNDKRSSIKDIKECSLGELMFTSQDITKLDMRSTADICPSCPSDLTLDINDFLDNCGVYQYFNCVLSQGRLNCKTFADSVIYIKEKYNVKTFLIEEPECYLHPRLQKLLPKLFDDLSAKLNIQFIVSTHSNYIISEALKPRDKKEDKKEYQKVYHIENGTCAKPEGISKATFELNEFDNINNSLGVKPSDLLFANGVIWVEGPSDAIDIEYWLSLKGINQGQHYEFSFYGGKILSHYTTNIDTKIVKILNINTKAIVYMDSDKKSENDTINETKKRIIKEFSGYTGSKIWVSDGKEIENYISKDMIEKYYKDQIINKKSKIICDKPNIITAFDLNYSKYEPLWIIKCSFESNLVTLSYEANKIDLANWIVSQKYLLDDFECDLKSKIKLYSELIKKWNS